MNRLLGGDAIVADRDTAGLRPDLDLWIDIDTFRNRMAVCQAHHHRPGEACELCAPALDEAVSLYGGDFLTGFALDDSIAFDEWQRFQTQSSRDAVIGALGRLVAWHGSQGDREYERAIAYARRWVALDPLHEATHRQLMALYARAGQRSAALRQYQECVRLLADELGVAPGEETTALFQRIRVAADGVGQSRKVIPPAFLEAAPAPSIATPAFVARELELDTLSHHLEAALAGQGQVVFVTGEAGQGKTALLKAFAAQAQVEVADLVVAEGHCNAYTGIGDPYLQFREILALLTGDVETRFTAGALTRDHALRLWRTLPATAAVLLTEGRDLIGTLVAAVPLAKRARAYLPSGTDWARELCAFVKTAQGGGTGARQEDLFEEITAVLTTVARAAPLLLVIDDLQWADPGTVSLLFHVGKRLSGSRILLVGAYRPEEVAGGRAGSRHPLAAVVQEFRRDWGDIAVDLDRADGRRLVQALVDSEPNALDEDFGAMLYRRTEGHPLYALELLRGMRARGELVVDDAGRWVEGEALDWDRLPSRVEAVIAGRIGRLDAFSQRLLRIASVEGEVFTAEVVADVAGRTGRDPVGELITRLSGPLSRQHRLVYAEGVAHIATQRLSHYRFGHILFQTYLYSGLDPAERASYHQSVGEALARLYGEQTDTIDLALARHFEEARVFDSAVTYLCQAAQRALRLSANQQAAEHWSRALVLLAKLPDSPDRLERELAIQLSLGGALLASHGYGSPEVGAAYRRARALCEQDVAPKKRIGALLGLSIYYGMRSDLQLARDIVAQMVTAVRDHGEPVDIALCHFIAGWVHLQTGHLVAAREHLQQAVAFCDHTQHRSSVYSHGIHLCAASRSWMSWVLWAMGYADQALVRGREALALAYEQDYGFSMTFAESVAGFMLHAFSGDVRSARRHNEIETRLADEHKLPYYQAASVTHRGRVLIEEGQFEEGVVALRDGLARESATGVRAFHPLFLTWLADAYQRAGSVDAGLATVAEALDAMDQTGESFFAAEAYRVRGNLLLHRDVVGAESDFLRAIEVARRQRVKMWELRATMSLARLWRDQGKAAQARDRLAQVYGWFTEGFEMRDLQEAWALLTELGG